MIPIAFLIYFTVYVPYNMYNDVLHVNYCIYPKYVPFVER